MHADLLIVNSRRAAGTSEMARRRGPNFVNNRRRREREGYLGSKRKSSGTGGVRKNPRVQIAIFSV